MVLELGLGALVGGISYLSLLEAAARGSPAAAVEYRRRALVTAAGAAVVGTGLALLVSAAS